MGTIDTRYYDSDNPTVLKIKSGDSLNADNSTILVTDSGGNDVDLSGYDSGKLLIKNKLSDADASAILSFYSAAGELVLQNGSYYLVKAAADTKISGLVGTGKYKFCLKVVTGTTEITADEGDCYIDGQGVE